MATRKLTDTEQAAKIQESFATLENQRTAGLELNREQQETKAVAQNRERARLVRKYGETHPRVTRIDRQLNTNPQLFRANDEEIVRSKVRIPQGEQTSWMVYGTVRDARNIRMPGLTLSLFDEQGKWVRELGYVCTDARGFYALKIEDPKGQLSKKYTKLPLFLRVTNDEKAVLHTEKEPLFLAVGKTDNREIVLEDEGCGTPPGDDKPNEPLGYLVQGTVTDAKGQPLPGLTVRAVDMDLNSETPLGKETRTDEKGQYRIPYKVEDFNTRGMEIGGADIVIYVLDESGKIIYKSEIHKNSPRITTIDIDVRIGKR